MESETPDTWAIVELLGHLKICGRLSDEERFGIKMARLDIPDGDGFNTIFFGGSAVYKITIVTEAVARHVAMQANTAPVSAWDFPKQLAMTASVPDLEADEDECDENEYVEKPPF